MIKIAGFYDPLVGATATITSLAWVAAQLHDMIILAPAEMVIEGSDGLLTQAGLNEVPLGTVSPMTLIDFTLPAARFVVDKLVRAPVSVICL